VPEAAEDLAADSQKGQKELIRSFNLDHTLLQSTSPMVPEQVVFGLFQLDALLAHSLGCRQRLLLLCWAVNFRCLSMFLYRPIGLQSKLLLRLKAHDTHFSEKITRVCFNPLERSLLRYRLQICTC
jgi:hypothetical protein